MCHCAKIQGTTSAPTSYRKFHLPFEWSGCSISGHRYLDHLLPFLLHPILFLLPSLSSILQGISSSTMSSFLYDSATDMAGSDSRGSIEQPMMAWEVISFGGSSSKDTHYGASYNKSSSSERVRDLCCTGRGTSRPHGRARSSTTSRKPTLVIVILSSSTSWGVRRGSGSGDVRASPFM